MDQSPIWNDWEDFIPHGKDKISDPPKYMPNLNMKVILWNIRGGSSDTYIPHALTIIQAQNPSIFIILKTKSDESRARQVCRRLGFLDFKAISVAGLRGGIWLLRKNNVDLVLYNERPNYFHSLFHFSPDKHDVLITGMHAPSSSTARYQLWNDMQQNLPPYDTP